MLDYEREWWTQPGPKETAIQQRFQLSSARYYQLLSELIDTDEAKSYDPLVVLRLRRQRERRRRARFERRSSEERRGR